MVPNVKQQGREVFQTVRTNLTPPPFLDCFVNFLKSSTSPDRKKKTKKKKKKNPQTNKKKKKKMRILHLGQDFFSLHHICLCRLFFIGGRENPYKLYNVFEERPPIIRK
jgi:hypothetical protein